MSPNATLDRLRPHAPPVLISAIVTVAVGIVPLLVFGEASTRTYAITAAVVILAGGAVLPYALFVGIGTLPLLYAGVATYAAPHQLPDTVHSLSLLAALRHVIAGVAYTLGAAVVGAIGFGAQMGTPAEAVPWAIGGQPAFLLIGGTVVAGAFVSLQLWRYDTGLRTLDRRTILGTTILGVLLALSPVVAFWVFDTT